MAGSMLITCCIAIYSMTALTREFDSFYVIDCSVHASIIIHNSFLLETYKKFVVLYMNTVLNCNMRIMME